MFHHGERPLGWAAVIVNFNSAVFLDACLRALYASDLPPSEVVVVDNASTDDSLLELQAWPAVVVEASPVNLGFAAGANRGIAATEAPIVLLLNPDVEVDRSLGRELVRVFAESSDLGAAGAKLRYPDSGRIQHAGGILHQPLLSTAYHGHGEPDDGRWDRAVPVDFVTGGAMGLRRAALDAVGGFDEAFWPAYYEDVDLCVRLQDAGWAVRYEPSLTATHAESVTLGQSDTYFRLYHRNRLRFAVKHLSPEYWWGEFLPAEANRLRGELSAVADATWPVRSGAAAIEELARGGLSAGMGSPTLLDGNALANTIASLELARQTCIVQPGSRSSGTFLGRVRGRLGWPSHRQLVDDLVSRQQVFNDAVVRTLEAQDRQNREMVSALLLTMLCLGYHAGGAQPQDDSNDHSDDL